MKFKIGRASGYGETTSEKEINTLEELLALATEENEDLVLRRPREDFPDWRIIVYDDYLE